MRSIIAPANKNIACLAGNWNKKAACPKNGQAGKVKVS
jgi:hypothetical protein